MRRWVGGRFPNRGGFLALAALVAWIASGCGKPDQTSQTASAAPEVRGEPIRGEPIQPVQPVQPAQPVQPVSTPSAPEVAPAEAAPPPVPSAVAANRDQTAPPDSALSAPSPSSPAASPPATVAVAGAAPAETSGLPASGGTDKALGTPEKPLAVAFEKLASFQYDVPDGMVDTNAVAQGAASKQIPESIRALNNQFVSLKGFMLPLKVEKGAVTELLIMRDQSMCCYGTVPRINEWVSVKMVGSGVKAVMDQAVTLYGTLKVGEMYENGYLVGIYAMDGERMAGPLDL